MFPTLNLTKPNYKYFKIYLKQGCHCHDQGVNVLKYVNIIKIEGEDIHETEDKKKKIYIERLTQVLHCGFNCIFSPLESIFLCVFSGLSTLSQLSSFSACSCVARSSFSKGCRRNPSCSGSKKKKTEGLMDKKSYAFEILLADVAVRWRCVCVFAILGD